MISKVEQKQIKALVQDPKWQTLENLVEELIEKIRDDSIVGDSEWETLRTALLNEGRIRGMRDLIQEAYRTAQNVE